MMKMQSLTSFAELFLAQAAPSAPSGQPPPSPGSMFISLLPMILIFVGIYFILIAPQRKKQKETEKMISALGVGDEVLTTGGIYGEITSVKSDRFVVRVADNNTKLEVGKGFVQAVVKKSEKK